ncbi:hypothetical protein CYMTET_28427 [Cymbomonas tetramitiformis]|uniref:PRONE domain-containing protein n=1 Tax=Cymbomonas tetramitiformis TaxID=36881 RepID=A0AAE0FPD5_9CHLO|nr:hypothetical protein CYMTET_28427 [Cymbomonas tetramitiformis]
MPPLPPIDDLISNLPTSPLKPISQITIPYCPTADIIRRELEAAEQPERASRTAEEEADVVAMRRRFSQLLLGEDRSGGRHGRSPALAISNAITNLAAATFGDLRRLAPLSQLNRAKWERELQWLLSPCEEIVERVPSTVRTPGGIECEVLLAVQRSDLHLYLPLLRRHYTRLQTVLDAFASAEFWYENSFEETVAALPAEVVGHRWWLHQPCVPPGGMSGCETQRVEAALEEAQQCFRAIRSINSQALGVMEVPEEHSANLPGTVRAVLGEQLHRYLTAEPFFPDLLLDKLRVGWEGRREKEEEGRAGPSTARLARDLSDQLEMACSIWGLEAAAPAGEDQAAAQASTWRARASSEDRASNAATWRTRAETLLTQIKVRRPSLGQTKLEALKIEHNRDVGLAVVEAYSRVLESLAACIISRVRALLFINSQAAMLAQCKQRRVEEEAGNSSRTLGGQDPLSRGFLADLGPSPAGTLELSQRRSQSWPDFRSDGLIEMSVQAPLSASPKQQPTYIYGLSNEKDQCHPGLPDELVKRCGDDVRHQFSDDEEEEEEEEDNSSTGSTVSSRESSISNEAMNLTLNGDLQPTRHKRTLSDGLPPLIEL